MLRPRGMGIMDFIAKTGADLITPPQASPVFQGQTPLQTSMGRPEVQFSQPSASTMATSYPSGMVAMASPTPQVQAMMRGQTPERTATVTPPQVTSARPQMLEPNRMMGPRGAVGSGVMQEGVDREKMIAASKIAEVEAKNPELKADPSFQDRIKGLFGDREKMLGLALAFNSMRLRPDTGLATVIGSELKDIRSQRVASRTSEAVADRLEQMGYANEAALVRANPELASSMVTLITKPDKPTSAIGKLADDLSKGRITKEQYDLGVEAIKKSGVNIEMGEKARTQALGQAGKDIFSADIEAASGAQKALESIQKADETLSLLASGAPTTGLTASFRNVIDNALSFIGDEAAINRASDTALLNSLLGQDVFGAIGALGIGARGLDTPAEREFLREVMTGRIDMTDESLRKITALRRRYAERAIKAYNKKLERGDFDLLNKEFGDRYKPIEIPEAPEVIYTEAPEIGFTREYQGATWAFKGGNPYDANNWEKQ